MNKKETKDFKVYFNGQLIFKHIDFTICIEFALHVHRSSNTSHKIDIIGDNQQYYSIFERKLEL